MAGWIASGVLAVALVGVLAYNAGRGSRGITPPPTTTIGGGGAPASDISNLTPRERAFRLFDRMMMADIRGDQAELNFFRPMALQAYAMLGAPDDLVRYDVGMIHLVTNEIPSARAQLDSLQAESPNHLLGFILAYRIAERESDADAMNAAAQAFLAAYPEESDSGNPDYQIHGSTVQTFLQEVQSGNAGSGNPSGN